MADSNNPQSPGMPMFPDPVNPDDLGRGPVVIGVTWTFNALALIVVAIRFWVRIAVTKVLGVEDWLMLAAVILNTVFEAFITIAFENGFGKHDRDLTFDQLVAAAKWTWLATTPGLLCSILARTSIAILLVRIFGTKTSLKWFLIVITTLQVVGSVLAIILSWVQVRPIEGTWNPLIEAERMSGDVLTRTGNVVGVLLEALSALGDLLCVLFPVMIVWKLNMPLHRKAGLCVLLALSLFTMGVSIANAVTAAAVGGNSEDAMYNTSYTLMCAGLEQEFVIMMGCAPTLSSIRKLQRQIPSVFSISESIRKLVSNRGTGYEMQDSNGLGHSSERIYTSEIGPKGSSSARGSSRNREVYQLQQNA